MQDLDELSSSNLSPILQGQFLFKKIIVIIIIMIKMVIIFIKKNFGKQCILIAAMLFQLIVIIINNIYININVQQKWIHPASWRHLQVRYFKYLLYLFTAN